MRNESGRVFVCHGDPALSSANYARFMDEERQSHHCIERKIGMRLFKYLTVSEYVDGMKRAASLSNSKARSFHGVIWAEGAPRVEELTLDWHKNSRGDRLRICDWSVYDAQMSELVGLDAPLGIGPPPTSGS